MSQVFPINADPRFRIYIAEAGQTAFAVPFPWQDNADIKILRTDLDDVTTTLNEAEHYQLTGAGDVAGGTMTLNEGEEALEGETFLILGDASLVRVSSIVQGGRFRYQGTDNDLDRFTIIAQEISRELGRALRTRYGVAGGAVAPGPAGSVPLWMPDGGLGPGGPDANMIADAQANAAAAAASAAAAAGSEAAAETAENNAEAAQAAAAASQAAAAGSASASAASALAAMTAETNAETAETNAEAAQVAAAASQAAASGSAGAAAASALAAQTAETNAETAETNAEAAQAAALAAQAAAEAAAAGAGVTDGDKTDVTVSAAGTVWTIKTGAVTPGKMSDGAALSLLGRSANSSGVRADIAAASDHQVMRRSGTAIAFGSVNLAQAAAVTGVLPAANLPDATTAGKGISEFATIAEYRTGTDTVRSLVVDQVWGAAALAALTDGANIAVDLATGFSFGGASNAVLGLGGDRSLSAPSNLKTGQAGVLWFGAVTSTRVLTLNAAWLLLDGVEAGPYSITTAQELGIAYFVRASRVYVTAIMRRAA